MAGITKHQGCKHFTLHATFDRNLFVFITFMFIEHYVTQFNIAPQFERRVILEYEAVQILLLPSSGSIIKLEKAGFF